MTVDLEAWLPSHPQRQPVDCYHFSCSGEYTVALHVIALSVSGLEQQNSTLGKDSFPKQIPWLLTQC